MDVNTDLSGEVQSGVEEIFLKNYVEPQRPEVSVTKAELHLSLKNSKSFHFAPRRLAYNEKQGLRKLLDTLLKKKIIRVSHSEYASPIVLLKKKTGDLRLCVDFRELNKLLISDNYPLPNIEDLLGSLHEKKYFSTLDLKDGFYHVRMAEESVKYTAFTMVFGQFEFLRMPFGLKVAPSRFQRYINQVLADLIRDGHVVVYMDDILVASETVEQHFKILREVFSRMVNNNLQLRLDKCKFLYTHIEFLGYEISEEGISPTKHGIEAVLKIPVPRSIKEVHNYVALCSYFRKFIPSFSQLAKPLYDMLKKGATFKFGEDELRAFEILKEKLVTAPVLVIYNPARYTELHCDASSMGFGAVLLQRQKDGQLHPVFFFFQNELQAPKHGVTASSLRCWPLYIL